MIFLNKRRAPHPEDTDARYVAISVDVVKPQKTFCLNAEEEGCKR
jgi:hypothetical protein